MDVNVSKGKAVCTKINTAASRMKICLADLKVLSEMIQSFPDEISEKIESQASITDALENMNQFNVFFHNINSYFLNLTSNFKQQMQIILSDNYNNRILNFDDTLDSCLPVLSKQCSETRKDSNFTTNNKKSPSSSLENFKPEQYCSDTAMKKNSKCMTADMNNKTHASPNSIDKTVIYIPETSNITLKATERAVNNSQNSTNPESFVTSTPCRGYLKHIGIDNQYDSSNDLPEAEENRNRISKQTPDSSNMNDGNFLNSSTDVTVFENATGQNTSCVDKNKNLADTESLLVSSSRLELGYENLNPVKETLNNSSKVTPEANSILFINSQISESLLNDEFLPAEKEHLLSFDDNFSSNHDPVDNLSSSLFQSVNGTVQEKNKRGKAAAKSVESLSQDETVPHILERSVEKVSSEMNETNKEDDIVSTTKKVNDWLNKSLQSESLPLEDASDGKANEALDSETNEDSRTEILDFNSTSKHDNKDMSESHKAGNENNDILESNNCNGSVSTTIYSNEKSGHALSKNDCCENVSNDSFGEVISLSDDDDNTNKKYSSPPKTIKKSQSPNKNTLSVNQCISKYKNNPNVTITPVSTTSKANQVEVVELEEIVSSDDDECCVIESSPPSPSNLYVKINRSSDTTTKKHSDTLDVESKSILNNSDNQDVISDSGSSQSYSFVPLDDDEAKRKLLASSSSPTTSSLSSLETSDSDNSQTINRKKFKKRKMHKARSDEDVINQDISNKYEKNSLSSESEDEVIKKMGNWKSLKKRKLSVESSRSSSENDSTKKIKTNCKKPAKISIKPSNELSLSSAARSTNTDQSEDQDLLCFKDINEDNSSEEKQVGDIYRDMLLASNSSSESDICSGSVEASNSVESKGLRSPKAQKRCLSSLDNNKKQKKRKFDSLLDCYLSLSDSDASKSSKEKSDSSQILDRKYFKKLEKEKKLEEQISESDVDSCDSKNNEDKNKNSESNLCEESPEEVAAWTSNVEDSDEDTIINDNEDIESVSNDEDDNIIACTNMLTICDNSATNDQDDQLALVSQTSNNSGKLSRKNIRKVITAESLTLESKIATKEEEERRRRLSEREKIFSQALLTIEQENEAPKLILDFDHVTMKELVCVHPDLVRVLKSHQVDGIKFMWNTCFESVERTQSTKGSGCVLAHCMGLGKSLQVVSLIHTLINHPELGMKTILIVCPKSVVLNWKNEFRIWLKKIKNSDATDKKVSIYDLSNFSQSFMKERRLKDWHETGGVMILSYSALCALTKPLKKFKEDCENDFLTEKCQKHLLNPGPDVIICDEGHVLKNIKTSIASVANEIQTKRRIVLTGTPMQNNLVEYYHMVNFVKPNYLGAKKEFMNRFNNPIVNGQFEDSTPQDVKIMKRRAHVLHKKLNGIIQRFDSNLLENHLPQKYEYVLRIRLTDLQVKAYIAYVNEPRDKNTGMISMFKDSFFLSSHLCNHPITLFNTKEANSSREGQFEENKEWKKCLQEVNLDNIDLSVKTILFFEILDRCHELGDKLLLFSQSLNSLSMLEHFLHKSSLPGKTWVHGKDYFRLDGKTPLKDREEFCQTFNNPLNSRARLFLLSSKAGGLGINLTGANRAIMFDVSWNPSVDTQSVFRIYRFGQKKTCYVYRFVSKGTMEEKIYDRQITKLSTSCRVVDAQQISRHYPQSYLSALYQYDFNYNKGSRPTPKVPVDKILAELVKKPDWIDSYDEHNALLANITDEELNEDERQKAWEEFENEKNSASQLLNLPGLPGISLNTTSSINDACSGIKSNQPSEEFSINPKSSFTTFSIPNHENKGESTKTSGNLDKFDVLDKKLEAARSLNEMLFLKQIIPLPYKDSEKPTSSLNLSESVKPTASAVNINRPLTSAISLNMSKKSVVLETVSANKMFEEPSNTTDNCEKENRSKTETQKMNEKVLSEQFPKKNSNSKIDQSVKHQPVVVGKESWSSGISNPDRDSCMPKKPIISLKSIIDDHKYFSDPYKK